MAKPTSTILDHPRRRQIDQALAEGQSIRQVAVRFGVSKDALHRYRKSSGAPACNPLQDTPPTAPPVSPQGPAAPHTAPGDPFDILSARYPWPDETPRPGPLAEQLRQTQRQFGRDAVRVACLSLIAQHQFTGLPDAAIGRQLNVPPAHVAAWRVEQEREQLALLSRDPRSILARELAALDQRQQLAWQQLSTTKAGGRTWVAAQSTLNVLFRQRMELLRAAGVSLEMPEPPGRSTTPLTDKGTTLAAVLQRDVADLLVNGAGVSSGCDIDQGFAELGEALTEAWAVLDAEPEDTNPPSK